MEVEKGQGCSILWTVLLVWDQMLHSSLSTVKVSIYKHLLFTPKLTKAIEALLIYTYLFKPNSAEVLLRLFFNYREVAQGDNAYHEN